MTKISSSVLRSLSSGKWKKLLSAILVLLFGALLYFFVRDDAFLANEVPKEASLENRSKARVKALSDESAQSKVADLTPADDSTIAAIAGQMKEMESKRALFCRKVEDDSRILYEYLIKCPDPNEILRLKELASGARGLTEDPNGERISWKLHFLNEFIPSPKYEYLILTVKYNKSTGRGRYDVTGIPNGNLDMRDGVSPISRDGKLYPIFSNIPVNFDSDWRFNRFFDDQAKRDEEE